MPRVIRHQYKLSIVCVALLTALAAFPAHAFQVSPLVLEMTSTGGQAQATIRAKNDKSSSIPVEITFNKLTLGVNGEQNLTDASDRFFVFPPQATIAPGASQAFHITWVGDQKLSESETYFINVKELPISLSPGKSGIKITMGYTILAHVIPPRSKDKVALISVDLIQGKKGQKYPRILVGNTGNRFGRVSQGSLTIQSGDWKKTYFGDELAKALSSVGVVQPGRQRRFVLKSPIPENITNITADLNMSFTQ